MRGSMAGVIILQLRPMLIAVSCLSPVRTHTWISAAKRLAIVSGTLARIQSFNIGKNLYKLLVRDDPNNQRTKNPFLGVGLLVL